MFRFGTLTRNLVDWEWEWDIKIVWISNIPDLGRPVLGYSLYVCRSEDRTSDNRISPKSRQMKIWISDTKLGLFCLKKQSRLVSEIRIFPVFGHLLYTASLASNLKSYYVVCFH